MRDTMQQDYDEETVALKAWYNMKGISWLHPIRKFRVFNAAADEMNLLKRQRERES